MPYTLSETFRQIDPFVQLNDGHTIATVELRLMSADHRDLTEYTLGVDATGRLLIYRLDHRGVPIRPAAFVEEKLSPGRGLPAGPLRTKDFGFSITGYV